MKLALFIDLQVKHQISIMFILTLVLGVIFFSLFAKNPDARKMIFSAREYKLEFGSRN